ncbi:MAG: thiamine biosynthesis protein ThiF [Eubacterium sp.]|nr:thiamine biosynthesis protein ThiF [Eubacterium sp.]
MTKEAYYDALAQRHGTDVQKRFEMATVAIAGLGGLGSNIAICLARAGIGKLILIDDDRVDLTNLHRQQYKVSQVGRYKTDALRENLMEMNPFIEVETYCIRMTRDNLASLLQGADIICEAFDDAKEKAMLVNGVLEHLPSRYLIAASGMAGDGSANAIITQKRGGRFYLCGDGISDVNSSGALLSSRVMVCAAHEAHMVLRILIGHEIP